MTVYSVEFDPSRESDLNWEKLTDEVMTPKAVLKRRQEFVAGRYCAFEAIGGDQEFNIKQIEMNEDRSPRWPDPWVGSITHCHGFASAAVARKSQYQSLGIDTEVIMTDDGAKRVEKQILLEAESVLWREHFQQNFRFNEFVTLIFSAKEALYKCLNPLVGKYFGFHEAQVLEVDLNSEKIKFELLTDLSIDFRRAQLLTGHFSIDPSRIHTGFTIN